MQGSVFAARARRRALVCASASAMLLALAARPAWAAATVDTAQPYYDQNSTPLQQNPVVFEGGTFQPTTTFNLTTPVTLDTPGGTIDSTNGIVYLTGAVSGPGGLTITGAYGVALVGTNSYTGGTTIDAGSILGIQAASALTGNVLDNGYLQVEGVGNATYSNVISGSGGVEVSNAGSTLTLTGNNTATGGLYIFLNNTVQIGNGGSSGTWAGDIGDRGSLIFDRSGTITYSGSINDYLSAGSLTQAGAGTLILTGTNGYTGGTTINAGGTIQLGDGTSNGSVAGNIVDNGALAFDVNGARSYSGVISGSGTVTVVGGTETLGGNNTYTGLTTIDKGGTLALSGSGTVQTSSGVVDNGTLDISGTKFASAIKTLSGSGDVTLGSNSLALTNPSGTFSGVISGKGGLTLVFGTETLTGVNTYTGQTTLDLAAKLVLSGDGSIAGSSLADGGKFDISGVNGAGASVKSLSDAGSVALGGKTLTLTAASGTFLGGISGSGGLTIAGGTETLSGVNTFTGLTTIDDGATLKLTGAGSIAASKDPQVDGTFDISGASGNVSVTSLSGADTGKVILGGNTLILTAASETFAGVISGSGGLHLQGGTETLTGVNTFTGTTTIDNGATLQLGDGTSGHNGSVAGAITDNGALKFDFSGSQTLRGSIGGSGSVEAVAGNSIIASVGDVAALDTVGGDMTIDKGATLTMGDGKAAVFLNGDKIVDNGALVVDFGHFNQFAAPAAISGSGTLEIKSGNLGVYANNTYTGLTTIDATGDLFLTGSGSISTSAGVVDNGEFDISLMSAPGTSITTISGSGGLGIGSKTLTLTAAAGDFSGDIQGGGTLKIAAGTETISGFTLFGGEVQIASGAGMVLTGNGATPNARIVDSGALDISGVSNFSSTGWIRSLAGSGTVTLGSKTLELNNASDTFASDISGTGGLQIDAGTETLTAVNGYSGQTTIWSSATLKLAGSGSIANSRVHDDGTFDISGASGGVSILGLSGAGSVDLGGNSLTLTSANDSFSGVISGSGGLTISGGTETLSGVNSFTGLTTIDLGATLKISGGGSIADSPDPLVNGTFDISGASGDVSVISLSGSGQVLLGANTLVLTAASETFSGVISGSGGLKVSGGTETLSGVDTYTGATTIDPGARLLLSGSGSIAGSSAVADNGTFDISGTKSGASIKSLSGSGAVALGSRTLSLTKAADTFSGIVSGAGGLEVAGGTETLSGVNGYAGATTIDGGATLKLAGVGSVAASSGVVDNGTFDISGTGSGASITTLSGDGSVDLGSRTLTLIAATGTFSGAITGSGGLTLAAGTETLTGPSYGLLGSTTIAAGARLNLIDSGSLLNSSVIDDGTLDISGTYGVSGIASLGGSGSVVLGASSLVLNTAHDSFAGVISGTGGITVSGGRETLTGVNTYTGETTILASATLKLAGAGSIAQSSRVTDDGVFDISGATSGASIKSLAGAGQVRLGAQALTLTQAGDAFSGAISGSGGLTIAAGSETLSGASSYSGLTTIAGGATLTLAGGGGMANSAVRDDGLLDVSSTASAAEIKSLSGSGAVTVALYDLYLTDAADTFSGVISGAGGLYVSGGTETLAGINTYTGPTGVAAGATLYLKGAGSVADSDVVVVNGGGTLDISGASGGVSVIRLAGGGLVNLGSSTLTITAAQNDEFAGVISGKGGLTLAGGQESLVGENTFTGPATIDKGATLQLGVGGSTGSVVSDIVDDGTLIFDHASAQTYGQVISGSGAVTVAGSGRLTFTADQTYAGATSISKGSTLQLGAGGAGGSVASSLIRDDGLLAIDRSAALAYGGTIQGSGALKVAGTGPLILTGANAHSGGTTIDAGATLQLGAGGTSGSIAGDITDDGALVFARSDTVVFGGSISGTGDLTQAGPGMLVLNGVDTVSGRTEVAAGTLEVGDAADPGAVLDSRLGGVLVDAGGTLRGHGTINGPVTNNGVVAPGGSIGTLTVASFTQGPGGSLDIEVAPAQASRLNVLGPASLGGTLNLAFDPGSYGPHVYDILTAASVSGTFATVNRTGAPAGMVSGLAYGATGVELVQAPTANAAVYGEVSQATLDRAQSFASLVEDSFGSAGCASGAGAPRPDDCNGMRAWAQVIGSTDHVNATASGYGFTNKGAGVLGGLDRRWSDGLTLGVALGYADNELSINAAQTNASGRSYYAGVYGRWASGPLQLDAQGFWMKTDWPLRRLVAGFGTASANPNGDTEGFLAQVSAPLGATPLRPYARFTYAHFGRDAATETGLGPVGYQVQAGGSDAAVGEAGLIVDPASVAIGTARLFPTLRLGIQQDFSSRTIPLAVGLVGVTGADFTSAYDKPGRTTGVVAAALKAAITPRFDVTGDIRTRFGSGQSEAAATVGGVVHF